MGYTTSEQRQGTKDKVACRRWLVPMLHCITVTLVAAAAQAGVLKPGPPKVEDVRYEVPVYLSEGDGQVAALNFTLSYDPSIVQPVGIFPGAASAQSGKVVTSNLAEPGQYIIVVMGFNQTAIGNGEVARVAFEPVAGASGVNTTLSVANPTLSTWDGAELPVQTGSTTLRLSGGGDEGEGEGEGEPGPLEGEPEGESEAPEVENTPGNVHTNAGDSGDGPGAETGSAGMVRQKPGGLAPVSAPDSAAEKAHAVRGEIGSQEIAANVTDVTNGNNIAGTVNVLEGAGAPDTAEKPKGSLTVEAVVKNEEITAAPPGANGSGESETVPRTGYPGGAILVAAGVAVLLGLFWLLRSRLVR